MALKHVALIFLFALFLSSLHEIQARDSQMFNKIPSKTNEVVVEVKQPQQNLPNKEATDPTFNPDQQQENEPNFIPENSENNYGLYGHESGQFSPTQTQNNQNFQTNPNPQNNFPNNAKYLPKNYNTVAYVTQPEDFNDNSFGDNGYTTNKNNNNYQTQDNSNNYYNVQKKGMSNEFDLMDNEDTSVNENTNKYYTNEAHNNNNKNSYYNNYVSSKNNNFNTRFMDDSETSTNNFNTRFMDDSETSTNNNFNTRFMDDSETSTNNNNDDNNNYFNSGKSRVNRVEPEGMSDTRFMENGKYHYDINSGKYSRDHPYMNPMAMRTKYNPTGYSNIDNSYQYNNYNEEEQYQNEDNMP